MINENNPECFHSINYSIDINRFAFYPAIIILHKLFSISFLAIVLVNNYFYFESR